MKRLIAILGGCLVVTYPLIVFFGIKTIPLNYLGGFFVALALLRLWTTQGKQGRQLIPLVLAVILILVVFYALLVGEAQAFRYYPVAVNGTLLFVFATSLLQGTPVVEKLARLQEPNLPATAIVYTRKVTFLWCGFFMINGAIALYTSLYSSFEWWAWYNGGISYLMMGVLFAAEWLVRQRVRQKSNV